MKLSVIVPALEGRLPPSLVRACARHEDEVEIVVVSGVSPVGKARNLGLDRARGEWIAWVDSDDEVSENWFEDLRAAISTGDERVEAWVFDAKNIGRAWSEDFIYGKLSGAEVVRDVYGNDRLEGHLWRTVTRRRLWDGLRFDENITVQEDFLLLPQVLVRANRIEYLSKILYHYLHHDDSTLNRVNPCLLSDGLYAAERRLAEAPSEYRCAALSGSMRQVYNFLSACKIGCGGRRNSDRESEKSARRFLLRHLLAVPSGFYKRVQYLCAACDFWLPHRVTHYLRTRR